MIKLLNVEFRIQILSFSFTKDPQTKLLTRLDSKNHISSLNLYLFLCISERLKSHSLNPTDIITQIVENSILFYYLKSSNKKINNKIDRESQRNIYD